MILKLMNSANIYTREVDIEENELVILNLITGDWVMTYPYYVDACLDNRGENYFQGSVVFKVTKNNLEIINNLSNSYEIFNAVNTLKDM